MLNFSNQICFKPPQNDEFEISLFGPGIGECLVIHIGNNEWIIIDSCVESSSKSPMPLVYLNELGVTPKDNVKLIIITHWHSDHIRGASKIFELCERSRICFSDVFLKEEFLAMVAAYSGLEQSSMIDRENCGTKEIASIIKLLRERIVACRKNPKTINPYSPASVDTLIYKNFIKNIYNELWALSPSPQTKINSIIELSSLMPTSSEKLVRSLIPKPEKNNNSVALLLKCGENNSILMGSDLEETSDPLTGWSAVVNSTNRPTIKSQVFKIPHHGSKNAHSHDVWEKMIADSGVGILTSKLGGRSSIPKKSDIERIKRYTPHLCCTNEPKVKKQKRDRVVEKTIKEIVKKRIPLNGAMGHIQIRFDLDSSSNIKVNLKEPAKKL